MFYGVVADAHSAKALCENSTVFAKNFVRFKTTCGEKHVHEVQMLLLCRELIKDILLQPTGTESVILGVICERKLS